MRMENDIFESLNNLNCPLVGNVEYLMNLADDNDKLTEFSYLIEWLSSQLSVLCRTDEKIHHMDCIDDLVTFSIETSSFLKELKCPYKYLYEDMNNGDRFMDKQNKLILLNYLTSELEAATMINANDTSFTLEDTQNQVTNENVTSLETLLISLGLQKPPANVTWSQIWSKVDARLRELLVKLPQDYLSKPILKENCLLTHIQWQTIEKINALLNEDFKSRREMLMKRLEVTVQSFKWSDKLKNKNDDITKIYQDKRRELDNLHKSYVQISDLLAARVDLTYQEKTCSTRLVTHSKLHKIIIENVPDRGGRTSELEPPPPEMPLFHRRRQTASGNYAAPQRERIQSGARGGRLGGSSGSGSWGQQKQQGAFQYDNPSYGSASAGSFKPQSDFEKFTNDHYQDGPKPKRGGGRGGSRY